MTLIQKKVQKYSSKESWQTRLCEVISMERTLRLPVLAARASCPCQLGNPAQLCKKKILISHRKRKYSI